MGIKYHIFNKGGHSASPPSTSKSARNKREVFGGTRSEQDKHLVEEGWGSSFMNEQHRDYCKFLESRIKDNYICNGKVFLNHKNIHNLMKQYGK